jgi:hypothetical protein
VLSVLQRETAAAAAGRQAGSRGRVYQLSRWHVDRQIAPDNSAVWS